MEELRLATYLDPRQKMRWWKDADENSPFNSTALKEAVLNASTDMARNAPDEPMEQGATGTSADVTPFRGFQINEQNGFHFKTWAASQFPVGSQEECTSTTDSENLRCELRRYTGGPEDPDADPMKWWRDRKIDFPLLSVVANKFLSAPPSSVESERTFSIGKRVYAPLRAGRLTANNGEDLIVLNQNLRYFDYKY